MAAQHLERGQRVVHRGVHDGHHIRLQGRESRGHRSEVGVRPPETHEPPVGAALDRKTDPHGQAARERRFTGPARVIEVPHHLHDDELGAAVAQARGLAREEGAGSVFAPAVVELGAVRTRHRRAHRRHGPCDHGTAARRRLARDTERDGVDTLHLVEPPEVFEQQRAAGEGVGGDDLGAGGEVGAVHIADDVRMAHVRLGAPQRRAHRCALPLDLGADTAVEQHHLARAQALQQRCVRRRGHACGAVTMRVTRACASRSGRRRAP